MIGYLCCEVLSSRVSCGVFSCNIQGMVDFKYHQSCIKSENINFPSKFLPWRIRKIIRLYFYQIALVSNLSLLGPKMISDCWYYAMLFSILNFISCNDHVLLVYFVRPYVYMIELIEGFTFNIFFSLMKLSLYKKRQFAQACVPLLCIQLLMEFAYIIVLLIFNNNLSYI